MATITIVPGPDGFEITDGDRTIRVAPPAADKKDTGSEGGNTGGADPTRGGKSDTKAGPIFYPPIFVPLFTAPKPGTLGHNSMAHIDSLDQLDDVIREFSRMRERLGGDHPHQLTVALPRRSVDIGRLHELAAGLDDDTHLVLLLNNDG